MILVKATCEEYLKNRTSETKFFFFNNKLKRNQLYDIIFLKINLFILCTLH